MALLLALHDLGPASPEAEQMFFASVFEVSSTHLCLNPGATLIATEVSPAYLLDLLRRAASRAGLSPSLLLVTGMAEDVAAEGLSAEGMAWLREAFEPPPA
jgi:hypothetical protein